MTGGEETGYVKADYPASEVTSRIIAAAQRVHGELGPGFEEVIYQRALALELPAHGLEFDGEVWVPVHYRGERVGRKRIVFFVEEVLVEIKGKSKIEDVDVVQTRSYLRSSGRRVALLINFGGRSLGIKRLIHTPLQE
jgi:GxxExxY protein